MVRMKTASKFLTSQSCFRGRSPQSPHAPQERCQRVRARGNVRASGSLQASSTIGQRRCGNASVLRSAWRLARWFIRAKMIATSDWLLLSMGWAQTWLSGRSWGFLCGTLWLSSCGQGHFHACPLLLNLLQESTFLMATFS